PSSPYRFIPQQVTAAPPVWRPQANDPAARTGASPVSPGMLLSSEPPASWVQLLEPQQRTPPPASVAQEKLPPALTPVAVVQAPPTHGPAHAWPHCPQFLASAWVSTQVLPHTVLPEGQAHVPWEQLAPPGHT